VVTSVALFFSTFSGPAVAASLSASTSSALNADQNFEAVVSRAAWQGLYYARPIWRRST
jgi:hypothetical protein